MARPEVFGPSGGDAAGVSGNGFPASFLMPPLSEHVVITQEGETTMAKIRARRRPRLGAALPLLGALTLVFAFTGVAPASAASSYLEADGESGTVMPPWSASAGAEVSSSAAKTGSRGYVVRGAGSEGYLRWSDTAVEQGHAAFSVRAWVQVKSRGAGESVDLITVTNETGVNNFDFFVTGSSSQFKWDLLQTDTGQSNFVVESNRWYLVEARGEFAGSTYNASVRIDGVEQQSISSPGLPATTVRSMWLGTSLPKTHEQWYDDVALRVGDGTVDYLGTTAATAPVVSTGCVSKETYRLTGTVTPNGVATTYRFQWGSNTSYGSSVDAVSAGSGTSAVPVRADVSGLTANAWVHYRLVATNAAGTSYGPDRSFRTASDTLGC